MKSEREENMKQSNRHRGVRPGGSEASGWGVVVAFLLWVASPAFADSFNKEISKGNKSYRQGDFSGAATHYRSAEIDRPGSPVAAYNLGTALVTGKNYEEALPKLGEATSKLTGPDKALAYYNIGNGFFGGGKFEEAAGAYKKTLEINPNDRDAKYNLELALKMLEEQKKNQKNQKNQKQNQKNEKKDKGSSSDSDLTQQKQNKSRPENQEKQKSPDQKEQQKMARPKQQMTKEEAERILAALKNEEMKVKKQKKAEAIPIVGGRDW